MKKIQQFQKEHRWLSNFAPCKIVLGRATYQSVEHAYMSAKSDDPKWKVFCQTTEKAGEVKKASRKIQLRPDWENEKVQVMKRCLKQKFKQEPYKSNLIATGNCIIEEGNFWHDVFWGIDLKTGAGKNILGQLIMEIRSQL